VIPRPSGEVSLATFDPRSLQDEGIRREFAFLEQRAQEVARSVVLAYDKPQDTIAFRYIEEREFNAYAGLSDGQYLIELNAGVPLFNLLLFYGLMSNRMFLPDVNSSGTAVSNFKIPFVIDPADFDRRAEWEVSCNQIRAFAAGTLADMCSTFIVLHEFGHVICGHCDAMEHFEGAGSIAELVAFKRSSAMNLERRRAWEGDADMVAAGILSQFVEDLAADISLNNRTKEVFADPDSFHLENTASIVVASLFALFCYIEATRRNQDKSSTHPQPHVRALLIKNVLHLNLERREDFDGEVFHRYLDTHLDNAMSALEDLGLFDPNGYSSGFSRGIDREFTRLKTLQERYRADCAKWSWIGWGNG
jgi:hypothetical protein